MRMRQSLILCAPVVAVLLLDVTAALPAPQAPGAALISSLLADTPLQSDLAALTDEIGGRATGSEANLKAVDWALGRFRAAGVNAWKEGFEMPSLWLENRATARISGDVSFSPRVVAMPFSVATPAAGVTAPLVDGGRGTAADFSRLGQAAREAFVLIETHELHDIAGLFQEYGDAVGIEARANGAGARGVVYMASRPNGLLYRHNANAGPANTKPMLIMERESAQRALRLLRKGRRLTLTAVIDVKTGGSYESFNVIGEIKGSALPEQIVIIGAHLDSWDLGTGALDNGCNVAMILDIARQMKRLGLQPRRTVRFALWNGEEQGLIGSWRYTQKHTDEMDNHVMALSVDIGDGALNGFFTNGRADLLPVVEEALRPVMGLGPFTQINAPIVGTDNYDFMMQGVPNLVGNQDDSVYGPNYHARSDTYDKVNIRQVRLNAAIVAALCWGFANREGRLPRQSAEEIAGLIATTDLGDQMKAMGVWQDWEKGVRGRKK